MPSVHLRSVTFPRSRTLPNSSVVFDLALPVPNTRLAAPAAVDWQRLSGVVSKTAVAFPMTADQHAPLKLSVELEIAGPLAGPLRVRARATDQLPFGDVAPLVVPNPGLQTLSFNIPTPDLTQHGVGQVTAEWTWEYSIGGGAWVSFQISQHEVFVIAGEPKIPWGRPGLAGTVVPWRNVYKRACGWALGTRDVDDAAAAIVESVYGLGGRTITTGLGIRPIEWQSAPKFARGERVFALQDFLKTAALAHNSESTMNCSDCAGAVAVLSSALGCSLRVINISPGGKADTFKTKPVQLLGNQGLATNDFDYHDLNSTVAANGLVDNIAWDACLMVDLDTSAKVNPGLATGMSRRPGASQLAYEALLIAGNQPAVHIRPTGDLGVTYPEAVPPGAPLIAVTVRSEVRASYAEMIGQSDRVTEVPAQSHAKTAEQGMSLIPGAHNIRQQVFQGALILGSGEFEGTKGPFTVDIARVPARVRTESQTQIETQIQNDPDLHAWLVTEPDRQRAVSAFLDIAAGFTKRLAPVAGIGDFALQSPAEDAIVFLRGNTVLRLLNDRHEAVALLREASTLDAILTRIYSP